MVAAVVDEHDEIGEEDPEPDGDGVGAQEQRPHDDRQHVDEEVFDGVGVGGGDGDGTLPLVMELVHVLIEEAVVTQPGGEGRKDGWRSNKTSQCFYNIAIGGRVSRI